MSTYKLTYFQAKALAEPIRFLLVYKGQKFEDYRFEREEWPSIKPSMPLGQAPILEIDGNVVYQSVAISRYLGKEFGLNGKNSWEDLQIDIVVNTVYDFRTEIGYYWYEENETAKAKKREVFMNETGPLYLGKLNDLAKKNNGYFANGKLSWGDLYFIGISDYLNVMLGFDMFEKYDGLRQLRDNVVSIPKIKEWIDRRPESEI